eukprot:scaffold330_cov109-Isochrysis_galbana.AAC.14
MPSRTPAFRTTVGEAASPFNTTTAAVQSRRVPMLKQMQSAWHPNTNACPASAGNRSGNQKGGRGGVRKEGAWRGSQAERRRAAIQFNCMSCFNSQAMDECCKPRRAGPMRGGFATTGPHIALAQGLGRSHLGRRKTHLFLPKELDHLLAHPWPHFLLGDRVGKRHVPLHICRVKLVPFGGDGRDHGLELLGSGPDPDRSSCSGTRRTEGRGCRRFLVRLGGRARLSSHRRGKPRARRPVIAVDFSVINRDERAHLRGVLLIEHESGLGRGGAPTAPPPREAEPSAAAKGRSSNQ